MFGLRTYGFFHLIFSNKRKFVGIISIVKDRKKVIDDAGFNLTNSTDSTIKLPDMRRISI